MEKKLGKRYGLELAVGAAVLAASTITAYLLMRKDRRLLEEKVKAFIHLGGTGISPGRFLTPFPNASFIGR